MNKSQLACAAVECWEQEARKAKERQKRGLKKIDVGEEVGAVKEILAERFNVSEGYIQKARKIFLTDPERFKRIKQGEEHIMYKPADKFAAVYVFKVSFAGDDFYKIGKTDINIESRLAHCQTGSPFPVTIFMVIPCDNPRSLEASLHREFAEKRMNGEWFDLNEEDILYCKSFI